MTTLLTPAQARSRIHLGRNRFYELVQRREIAVVMIGRKILVPESEVEKYIQGQLVPARRSYFRSHRSCPSGLAETK